MSAIYPVRTALVTGAAQGIGYAIAARLVRDGIHVIIADIDEEAATAAARELAPAGAASAIRLDLMELRAITELATRFEAEGREINIVVNNAGVLDNVSLSGTTPEIYERVMGINFRAPLFLCQQFARLMPADGRSAIVGIASGSALLGNQNRPVYGPAKAAVMALARALAVELASRRVRANAVAPGAIETPLTRAEHSPEVRAKILSRTPSNRYGLPEEIASAVAFLASDEASYVNGQTLIVDGGFTSTGFFDPGSPAS
jgi:3-oxoacyl-[acyl-carrier protein] reductase